MGETARGQSVVQIQIYREGFLRACLNFFDRNFHPLNQVKHFLQRDGDRSFL